MFRLSKLPETSNSGSSDAMNVMASVITSSPFLTLNNSSADLEDLTIGESAVATFNVTVDEAAPIGNVVDMVFTAQSGMYQVQKLTGFKVGLIIEDFETGDFDNYEWEHSGSSDWTITSSGAYEGTYAAKSGSINDMQESNLSITMEVMNDDEISFYHKVSSESSYDYLRFYIDGIVVDEWAGNTSWVQSSYPVTAGEHTFKWAYEKDQSVANGSDCGWIDYISFPAAASDAMIVYAGPDAETCDGDDYTTNATGSNYESIMWTTSGTGLFNDNTLMNPTYTPSSDDISNGYVMLTITGYQDGNEMSDEMELSFMEMPGQCAAPEGATELCVNPGITTYQTQQMLYVDDYMWELTPAEAGTITFDGMSAEVTWSAYFIGNAQIKVMGTNSCGDGEMSEPLDVSIMDIPQMAATPTGSYELCVNPGTINYEVAEVTNATAYVWELLPEDAGTITTENRTAQISWSESFTGIAQLKVMGTNLCGDGEMSEPLDVSIMNLPQMGSVPTGDVNLCDSDLTSVYATDEITDATEYIWMLVPTEAGTLSGNNMEVQVSWSDGWVGEAELSVKGANACGQGNPSDYLMVTRSTVPAQAGNISGPTEVCQGLNVTFDVAEISAATECEWVIEPAEAGMLNMDDNSCDIVFSSTWEGTATLMTRGINNCGNGEWSESFTLIVEDCTGIDEKNSANLSVYPNPNNGTFNISITGNESVDVKLVNAIGEVVYLENGVQINGNTNKNIETSDLANGIYYLHIHGQTMNSMEKIIVNK
jgi:hypothetical protein